MTGSIESAKDTAGGGKAPAAASPADLLKKAVARKPEVKAGAVPTPDAPPKPGRPSLRLDARLAAVATVALVVGCSFGLMAAPRERSGEALARIETDLAAGRSEASRQGAEIARLTTTLTLLRDTTEAAAGDMRSLGPGLIERLARLETGLDKKLAVVAERVASAEREPAVPTPPSTVAVERRAAVPAVAAALPVATATPKAEPTQTASIAETKPKAETVEAWALRDVYDGIAMLEDRKRRLIEVAPGDPVPGLGRVEAIERRGRSWVVVTKQGVITPQTW